MNNPLIYYNQFDLLNEIEDSRVVVDSKSPFVTLLRHYKSTIVDRLGVLDNPINLKSIGKLPDSHHKELSYEDCCLQRASEILSLAKSQNKKIVILYSGGIDSTTVLSSFLLVSQGTEKNLIEVALSEASIKEFPDFYKNIIHNKQRIINSAKVFRTGPRQEEILITGQLNDKLFGTSITNHQVDLADIRQKKNDLILEIEDHLIKKCPFPIETEHQKNWWLAFSLLWDSAALKGLTYFQYLGQAQSLSDLHHNYVLNFFETFEFQKWSIMRNSNIKKIKFEDQKQEAKELINKFYKNDNYLVNKIKVGSLVRLINDKKRFLYLDSNFNAYDSFASYLNK